MKITVTNEEAKLLAQTLFQEAENLADHERNNPSDELDRPGILKTIETLTELAERITEKMEA